MNTSASLKLAASVILLATLAWPSTTHAQDWGSIRGPHYDGSSQGC